jgi:hypothetical protein
MHNCAERFEVRQGYLVPAMQTPTTPQRPEGVAHRRLKVMTEVYVPVRRWSSAPRTRPSWISITRSAFDISTGSWVVTKAARPS